MRSGTLFHLFEIPRLPSPAHISVSWKMVQYSHPVKHLLSKGSNIPLIPLGTLLPYLLKFHL